MGWNAEEKASYFLNALEDMKAMLTDFDNAEDWEHAKTTARCLAWLSGNENWFEVSNEYWKKQQQKELKEDMADLKEIANGELRAYSEELENENSALQAKMDKAVEALKFYAEQEHYLDHCRDYSEYDNADWIEGNVENGQKAREALEEIENDRQS